eukprot:s2345_g13.t1
MVRTDEARSTPPRGSVDLAHLDETVEPVDYAKMLEEAAQAPSITPLPGGITQSEHEVQMANLEVRLRQPMAWTSRAEFVYLPGIIAHCLDLIGPTVRRAAAFEHDVTQVQDDLQLKSGQISDLMLTANKVEQQVATIENFRIELAKYDSERKQWQATATDSLSCMKQEP